MQALPKPKKSLKALDYYIEATDRAFGTSRTQEYRAEVVGGPMACQQDKLMGGTVGSATIVIEVPCCRFLGRWLWLPAAG